MRPITAWAHMMSSTVTVAPRTGQDGYGKPEYGAAATYRAHISRKRTLVRDAAGEQVESGQAVHLMTTAPILPTSLLTLSTGDAGSTSPGLVNPKILAVERRSDQAGPHHVVLYL